MHKMIGGYILPPLSQHLKCELFVRLPYRAKHKRVIPVCPTVLLDIMILWNFFRKDQKLNGQFTVNISKFMQTIGLLSLSLPIP